MIRSEQVRRRDWRQPRRPCSVGPPDWRGALCADQPAPSGIRRLGRQTTARDFRAVNKIMLDEVPPLEKLNEHGEVKAGTMAEAREAYKVET